MKKVKRYTADFETEILTEEQMKAGGRTYVWAWKVFDVDEMKTVGTGTSIKTFVDYISQLPSCEIWFHNLKFDSQFLLYYLIETGWTQVSDNKHMEPKQFSSLVSVQGITYSIELKFEKSRILILDSYKKLPFKVEKIAKDLKLDVLKGEIDYKEHREEGGVLSDQDDDYLERDVYIPAKAMKEIFWDKGFTGRTIGSDCMKLYKNMTGAKFFKYFPKLSENVSEFCRLAYSGGEVHVGPGKAGKVVKNGRSFDVNSLYPFIMHSKSGYRHPIGEPIYFEGGYEYDARHKFYIQHLTCSLKLLPGKIPTIHTSNGGQFREHEYITNTKGKVIELVLCCYDLELLFSHYDVQNIQLINGYKFETTKGIFDDYVDKFMKQKEQATIDGNAVERLSAKLFMNNLSGKFAQSGTGSNRKFFINEKGVLSHNPEYQEKDELYVPMAVSITAAARIELFKLVDYAQEHGVFCYCDTDSCSIDDNGELDMSQFNVHDTELGAWKCENTWTEAVFVRPKTYAKKIEGAWHVTGAGMNDEVKEEVIKEIEQDITSFHIGSEYAGKLMTKHIPGGVVLVDTKFKIRK